LGNHSQRENRKKKKVFQQRYFFLRKDNAGGKETREVKGSTDMVLNAEIGGRK